MAESRFITFLREVVAPAIKATVTTYTEDTIERAERSIYRIQKRIEKGILIGSLFAGGILFLVLGIVFLLDEYTFLSLGSSFAAVGFVLLLLSIIFMAMRS